MKEKNQDQLRSVEVILSLTLKNQIPSGLNWLQLLFHIIQHVRHKRKRAMVIKELLSTLRKGNTPAPIQLLEAYLLSPFIYLYIIRESKI